MKRIFTNEGTSVCDLSDELKGNVEEDEKKIKTAS